MDWIKRNSSLVIGGVVLLLIIGGGGYFLYAQIQRERAASEQLAQVRQQWENLERQKPHPGTENLNNIAQAQRDLETAQSFLAATRRHFESFNYPAVTNGFQFKTMLERSIARLRKQAEESGVELPSDSYAFTFRGQMDKVQFDPAYIQPWVNQLEEIKTFCELLYSRRVHSIESIRRVPIDTRYDIIGQDFIPENMVTNDVAVLVPYEVVFKGYSGELAGVLDAMANSDHCYRIKAIEVKPTTMGGIMESTGGYGTTPSYGTPAQPSAQNYSRYQLRQTPQTDTRSAEFERTYGGGARRGSFGDTVSERAQMFQNRNRGRESLREQYDPRSQGQYNQPATQIPRYPTPYSRPAGNRISDVVQEKPLQVTLYFDLIKPLPPESSE